MKKTIPITKVFNEENRRYIELRDYQLYKTPIRVIICKNDPTRCLHLQEEYMNLSIEQQRKGKYINTQRSMFYPYKQYRMVRFLFKPKGEVEAPQVDGKKIIDVNANTVRIEGYKS